MITSTIKQAIEELGRAFQEFKQTNEERIVALEKKHSDPLLEEKLSRMNVSLDKASDRLQHFFALSNRPHLESGSPQDDHKKAFLDYVCKGQESNLRSLESKRLDPTKTEDGGYFLPDSMVASVYESLKMMSPMRELASAVQTSHHQYELIIDDNKQRTQWGEELTEEERKKGSVTPQIKKITYPVFTLYDAPRISSTLLEDTSFHVESWLVELISKNMSQKENEAFIQGCGKKKPQGLLCESIKSSDKEVWGCLHTLKTGVNGKFAQNAPEEKLIELVYALRPEYLAGAKWLMTREVLAEIRKMKTSQGDYLWQPTLASGTPGATLLGYPVVICDDLPTLAMAGTSILFGNFKEGYVIVDRMNLNVLRDPYTSKPDIDLLVRRRVGGGWKDFRAIKGLSFSV